MVKITKRIGNSISTDEIDDIDFPYYDIFEDIADTMNQKACTMMSVTMPGLNIVFERRDN